MLYFEGQRFIVGSHSSLNDKTQLLLKFSRKTAVTE